MRNVKLMVLFLTAAVGGGLFQQAQATDTEMQARAREALRQKAADTTNQDTNTLSTNLAPDSATVVPPAATMTTPAVPVTPATVTPPADAIAPVSPAMTTPVAPVMPASATPSMGASMTATNGQVVIAPALPMTVEEQLREKMRQSLAQPTTNAVAKPKKIKVVHSKPASPLPVQNTPTYPVYAPTPYQQAPPVAAPAALQITPTPVTTTEMGDVAASETNSLSPNVDAQLREKMRQRMAELDAQSHIKKGRDAYDNLPYGYTPPVAPPVLVPGSKEQKLADLLEQYKADQVSPSEYHRKRAEIIAAP